MHELAIRTVGLTRRCGGRLVVDEVGLEVPRGAVYGLLGPKGAGKTTVIRLLLGLLRPDAGRVELLGAAPSRASLSRIGALVGAPGFYPHLTGRENLEVTRRLLGLRSTAIADALAAVRLTGDAGQRVAGYSLATRQRLALARALLPR
ncbi:MAG: ATP-binding cassette domain-containing protein, partial [Longimicrobiales bacterium]